MSIYLVGDMHGGCDDTFKALNTSIFPEQRTMTKDDFVIQLGDFGLWWDFYDTKEEKYWRKWLMEKNFQFCFLDGNHENFPKLNKDFKDIEFMGGKAKEYTSPNVNGSIIWLQRGEIYDFNGTKIFVMGGAESHDKSQRTLGLTWWEEEMPNYKEYDNALKNLEAHNFIVDYVLTHTAPNKVIFDMFGLLSNNNTLGEFFNNLLDTVFFKEWHCGHFHVNTTHEYEFNKLRCHYNSKPPFKLI